MCYYNSVNLKKGAVIKVGEGEKQVTDPLEITRWVQSGFDFPEWPVLKPNQERTDFDIQMMHWEFIPWWINNQKELEASRQKFSTLNATCENLLESRMYKSAAISRRCIVLSSGFYEWRHIPQIGKSGKPLKATNKIPYFVHLPGREVFFMAGIWQPWTDKETGETFDSFAIVTAPANELMAQVHNVKKRMPVILSEEEAQQWMLGDLGEKEILHLTSTQCERHHMKAYPVAKDFKIAADPREPAAYENLPELVL